MRKLFTALALTAAAVATAPASAATFFLDVPSSHSTVDFSNTSDTGGNFVDNFFFTVGEGSAEAFVSSIFSNRLYDVTIWRAFIDGVRFDKLSSGPVEFDSVGATPLDARTHVVTVIGNWGKAGGSYSGSLSFAGVPEPAAWTMMVAGFGLAGAALRARRRSPKVRPA